MVNTQELAAKLDEKVGLLIMNHCQAANDRRTMVEQLTMGETDP